MTGAEDILVLGHGGLLGRAVVEAAGPGCQVIAGGRAALDLGHIQAGPEAAPPAAAGAEAPPVEAEALDILGRVREDLPGLGPAAAELHPNLEHLEALLAAGGVGLVVNCAGYTDVDRAEREPELAMAANAQGAGAVARLCARFGAHLVHLSTDYVFDGRADRPYGEDDPAEPLSVYGRSKLLGERMVRAANPGALVVRSAWLFGPGRDNFVSKVLAVARAGRPLRVVRDQVGSPTYTRDLAQALIGLGRRRVPGLLHLVNRGQASRYELARQSLALAGLDPDMVQPIATADLGGAARRPAWSVLQTRRAARLLGAPLPGWLDALGRYINAEEVAA